MKLAGRAAAKFFANPAAGCSGVLIYGADSMRVALKRQHLITSLIGEEGEQEMRLTRISSGDLRKYSALLTDAIKAQGFFPGARVVFLEDATDSLTKTVFASLDAWQDGDATIVITAGQLAARSSLRKLFEGRQDTYAAGIYADPPSREDVEEAVQKAGIAAVDTGQMAEITALAQALDPGDFAQTLEKLALYKLNDQTPVSSADIAACVPATIEASLDDAIHLIAEARAGEVGPVMKKLRGQGLNPTTICISAARHFRTLHAAAAHSQGPDIALSRARPPVFGLRKERMVRQVRHWGMHRLEGAIGILTDTDLAMRSSRPVPAQAMLERAFIRIAMLANRQAS